MFIYLILCVCHFEHQLLQILQQLNH